MSIYGDEKFSWWDIIIRLHANDKTDQEIKKQLFFDEEKSKFMLSTISGSDLMNIIIRLNLSDDLDRKFKEDLFFNKEKLELMSRKLSGKDLMNIIIRLDSNDELDMRIKKFLFLNPEGFAAFFSIVSRSNADDSYVEEAATITQEYQQEKEIKEAGETDSQVVLQDQSDNKSMMNDTNTSLGGSNQKEEQEKQLFDYLDKIYYKDNGVSLNSKKLYMIQVASQVLGNIDLAKKIVTDNYSFDIREVDVNKINK